MRPTGPTNPVVRELVEDLRRRGYAEGNRFCLRLAELISRPRRRKVEVNLVKIERYASENDTVVVPGKVLGYGNLSKPVKVSAVSFSKKAEEKIKKAGGDVLGIRELVEKTGGSGVKILT